MPKLDKIFTIEITPEQFVRSCSREEMIELDMLLSSPHCQKEMYGTYAPAADNKKQINTQLIKIETT